MRNKPEKDRHMRFIHFVLALVVICGSAFAVDKMSTKHLTPRKLPDGRVYRQWCCPHCEQWNSGYGPPYTCTRCGYVMN